MDDLMREFCLKAIQVMRSLGYAVVVFEPDELEGLNPEGLEDYLAEKGNFYIEVEGGTGK